MEFLNSETLKKAALPVILGGIVGGTAFFALRQRLKNKQQLQVDCNSSSTSKKKCTPMPIEELPLEIRTAIWRKLNYPDILNLRLACELTKDDVENWIGLRTIVSSRKQDRYEFSQRVGLQSCLITDLTNDIDYEFFAQPLLLRNLEVIERLSMPLSNIKFLLEPCINLTTLKLRFTYSLMVSEISESILNAVSGMQCLKLLKIHRCATHAIEEKRFPRTAPTETFYAPRRLQVIEVELSDISEEQIARWKTLLDGQVNLKILRLNFGAIHWQFFERVIAENPKLEEVSLFGVKSYCVVTEQDVPLNWGIFSHLTNLRSLEVISPRTEGLHGNEFANCRNFFEFPCENIERFHVNRIIMSADDVDLIYNQMSKMREGSLNNIGDVGIARATELSWLQGHDADFEETWSDILADSRYFGVLVHCVIGLSMLSIVLILARNPHLMPPIAEEDDFL